MSIQLAIVILYIILLFAISMYVKHRASQNPVSYTHLTLPTILLV